MGEMSRLEHLERDDVQCEVCMTWFPHEQAAMTLDECYLCPTCVKDYPVATPEEVAEYFGERASSAAEPQEPNDV